MAIRHYRAYVHKVNKILCYRNSFSHYLSGRTACLSKQFISPGKLCNRNGHTICLQPFSSIMQNESNRTELTCCWPNVDKRNRTVLLCRCDYTTSSAVSQTKPNVQDDLDIKIQKYEKLLSELYKDDYFMQMLGSRTKSTSSRKLFKALKTVCCLKSYNLVLGYLKCLQEFVKSKKDSLTEEDRHELARCFDRILNFLSKESDPSSACHLFSFMRKEQLLSETSYTLMVRIHSARDGGSLNNAENMINEMISAGFQPNARTYFPVVIAMTSAGDVKGASKVFKSVKMLEEEPNDKNHSAFIDALVERNSNFMQDPLFHEVIDYHKGIGFVYGRSSKQAIQDGFQRMPGDWRVEENTTNTQGICYSCGSQLDSISISSRDITNMKKGLAWYLKVKLAGDIPDNDFDDYKALAKYYRDLGEIIKDRHALNAKVKDMRLTTLKRLKYFLQRTGPYDVIVDMLNLGYNGQKGFNAAKVEVVVRELLEEGRKVVGFCAGPLREYHLKRNIDVQEDWRIHKMIQRLHKWRCGLFFVGSSKIDDLFMIYGILQHNFGVKLLTEDRFQDHLYGMDKFAVVAFKKWMAANTIQVERFDDGKPIFKTSKPIHRVVQNTDRAWHFPLKNGNWLCCRNNLVDTGDSTPVITSLRGLESS